MPEENFKIRIRPDGKIYFRSEQLGEERLRQLREMLEDCLGPVVNVQDEDSSPPPTTRIVDKKSQHEEIRRKK